MLVTGSNNQRGAAALVTVLWVGTLMAGLALGFAAFVRGELRATGDALADARGRALARAGLERALADLSLPPERATLPRNGTPVAILLDGAAVTVALSDETGRIDLNSAPDEVIAGLMRVLFPEDRNAGDLAARILDWRDPDQARRPGGAELADYRVAGAVVSPRNAPFTSVEDLRDVLGLTPAHVARLRPHVTVLSLGRRVNPATATPPVLAAFPDVTVNQVQGLIERRQRGAPLSVPFPLSLWTVNRFGPGVRVAVAVRLPSGQIYREETIAWFAEETPERRDIRIVETTTPEP